MFHTPEIIATDVDWQAVYEEMRTQTIQGLVMDILPELPCPDDLKKLWRSECFQMVKNGIRLRYEQAEFLSILEKYEIPYVILKGTAAAMYYPNPMLRGMGDVDVYVPYRYHAELTRMLTENGYAQLKDKEDYVRHREFEKNAVEFEVHRAYAFVNSKKEKEYIDGLLEKCCSGEVKADKAEQGATVFYFPPKDINGIVLPSRRLQRQLQRCALSTWDLSRSLSGAWTLMMLLLMRSYHFFLKMVISDGRCGMRTLLLKRRIDTESPEIFLPHCRRQESLPGSFTRSTAG